MCTAEPLERTRVVLVPREALSALMDRSPAFTSRVAEAMAREVRRVLDVCEDVTLRSPVERLAHFLQARAAGTDVVELSDTQTQIASQLGTVREVVGRGLRALETRGAIVRRGRTVRVLDREALAEVAGNRSGT
jgi:CRP/FNR family transcriptional regulator